MHFHKLIYITYQTPGSELQASKLLLDLLHVKIDINFYNGIHTHWKFLQFSTIILPIMHAASKHLLYANIIQG